MEANMRDDIANPRFVQQSYEIRKIVLFAEKLQKENINVICENIGDPIVKGEIIPEWIKDIVSQEIYDNSSWAYSNTRGVLETREFLCARNNALNGAQITPNDIIFFNGLGDAISKIYTILKPEIRVLLPSPTYTTHSLEEARHAQAKSLHYLLDYKNNWLPDVETIENIVKYNEQIAAIMVINPDNPTGMVYTEDILKGIVDIARRYKLFLIFDETYMNIVYNNAFTVPLCKLVGEVPAISMKGISKEIPWPGARCGWIEVYNYDQDKQFAKYIDAIFSTKMNEVCATTLPQKVLPKILSHPNYASYLATRLSRYEKMSQITYKYLKQVEYLEVNHSNGAFYNAVKFKDGVLNAHQTLPIVNHNVQLLLGEIINQPNVSLDKRFVYYLLANSGICVVPLSTFATLNQGFRITLLESDELECQQIYETLAVKIEQYINSTL
jgi:aspartate/methionine/tyrosine aminotransferase